MNSSDPTVRKLSSALDSLWWRDPSRQARILQGFRDATERRSSRLAASVPGMVSVGVALVVVLTLALIGYADLSRPKISSPAAAPIITRFFALLASNDLVAYDDGAEKPAWSLHLAKAPKPGTDGYAPTGHYLAVSADGRFVYALPMSESKGASELDVIDAGSGRLVRRHYLATSTLYGTVAVGPRVATCIWSAGTGTAFSLQCWTQFTTRS